MDKVEDHQDLGLPGPAVNLDVADRPGKHGLPADTGEFVAVARALRAQGLAWCQPATGQQADASLSS